MQGYLDDRGELIEISWEQYQFFLWNGFPEGAVIVKAPEGPHEK